MLSKHGLAGSIHLEEGSGISRGNRFTARGLAQLLHLFLVTFEAALDSRPPFVCMG
jgi:D-alanyl-D-alanine carboxypeptidase/D-alanyl-D-alanine-endopeptidase (penicillin-binding protein 4)